MPHRPGNRELLSEIDSSERGSCEAPNPTFQYRRLTLRKREPIVVKGEDVDNINVAVKGNTLTLTVDLTKDSGRSKTGKTITVASSSGFAPVPDHQGIAFSLNVNKKP